ncbi:MAG: VWA domain-containing protein [Propionibacterium sp.]|nr:VWA domain-containing protein [Propionibacterium sp.]
MALTQPWWGALVLLVLTAVAVIAVLWRRRPRVPGGALPFAAAARLRSLPRFRALARRRLRWAVVEATALAVAAAGVSMLVARPVDVDAQSAQRSNRDVVLCMDVSGSMQRVVRDVLGAFGELAGHLEGERLALVLFDSAAVTGFPLTDDASFVREQLASEAREMTGRRVPGTGLGDVGSSLIGDGLVSCLQRFDGDPDRSRTVVLATDNQTSGRSLYSLDEAAAMAADDGVLVFGITPNDNTVTATHELTEQVRLTGGDTLLLDPNMPLGDIVEAVEATQRRELEGPARLEAEDLLWPGVGLTMVGVVGAAFARRRGMA